jgi:hypothetical protein
MSTTAGNLFTVIRHWPDLVDGLGAKAAPTWPPAGRMSDFVRDVEQREEELAAAPADHTQTLTTLSDARGRVIGYRCAHCGDVDPGHTHPAGEDRDPAQIGQRPIPIRLPVHETLRTVHQDLLDCADHVAAGVQKPVLAALSEGYSAAYRARHDLMVMRDRRDPRRWRWSGTRPDALYTAWWLIARVQGAPGPFLPMPGPLSAHVADVARRAAARVEAALDVRGGSAGLREPCPRCGGPLAMYGGAGAQPTAHCRGCGHVWGGGDRVPAAGAARPG